MTKKLKIILISAAALILLGGIIFLISLAAGGFSASGLSSTKTVNRVYNETPDNTINYIIIDYEIADVNIVFGDALSVSYSELYTKGGELISDVFVSDTGGNLSIRERIRHLKNIGLNASSPKITITLPRDRALSLNIDTDLGDVRFNGEGGNAEYVVISTDNGDVDMKNVNAEKINISAENGSIEVESLLANGIIKLDTENGDIDISGSITASIFEADAEKGDISNERGLITANTVNLSASLGDIDAILAGSAADYTVRVEKGIGSSNIKSSSGGDKRLEVECELGDIEIRFEK